MSEISETPMRPELEKSKNRYLRPFPEGTNLKSFSYDSPAHKDPFRGAIDFLVPLGTQALAPLGGKVIAVYDFSERYGDDKKYAKDVNYITIKHGNGEFSQVLHLEKGSAKVRVGDKVKEGQAIAISGNSGWMTEPHLHFFVFKNFPDGSFKGLQIQFKEPSSKWYNPRTWIHRK